MVITTEHALFAGGHFHSKELFERSWYGMMLSHYYGGYVTNEVHHRASTTFHRLAANYAFSKLGSPKKPNSNDNDEGEINEEDDELFPTDAQLAHLAVLIFHLEDLAPKYPANAIPKDLWPEAHFDADQKYARKRFGKLIRIKMKKDPTFKTLVNNAREKFISVKDMCEAALEGVQGVEPIRDDDDLNNWLKEM